MIPVDEIRDEWSSFTINTASALKCRLNRGKARQGLTEGEQTKERTLF